MLSPIPAAVRIIGARYEVIDELGRGSQGVTWRVRDRYQGEVVALKLLAGVHPFGPWHEAAVLTQLRDEHILPIRNADFFSGVPGIVTELALHGTIQDQINATASAGIDSSLAIRWTRQACLAVARTHDAGLVHTDIKPENLFLSEYNDVRLGDYGLASLIDAAGQGICSGTATTLAPEVAQLWMTGHVRGTTFRSDVYSLGSTIYHMLSGRPAFLPVPGTMNLAAIAVNKPPKLRDLAPHVPQSLSTKIERAMAADPTSRYSTAGEFAAALGGVSLPARNWLRTNEDAGHVGCWRGDDGRHATILVCAVPIGSKVQIETVKLPHRHKVIGASGLVTSDARLPAALRKIFKDLN